MDHECEGTRIDITEVEIPIRGVWLSDYLQESFIEHKKSWTVSVRAGEDQGTELDGDIKEQIVYELNNEPTVGHTAANKTGKAVK